MSEEEQRPQAERRDANPQGQTAAPFRFDRARLLPPAVVAPLRTMARQFLELSSRDKLLLVAVANRETPTEAGDIIAAAVSGIEATLAKPPEERKADLAAVALDVEKRLAPFAAVLAQIDPTRRATVAVRFDGRAELTPADAATARATKCREIPRDKSKRGEKSKRRANGEVVIPKGKPHSFDHHKAHLVRGCHNCRKGPGPHCINCRRVSHDDIRIERTPNNVRPDLTTEQAAPANPGANAPRATPLTENIENALRLFLATFAALPPVGILYLANKATTRHPETFEKLLRHFVEKMAGADVEKASRVYHRYGRATMGTAWKRIAAKNPSFAIFQTWSGHAATGHRRRKQIDAETAARIEAEQAEREAAEREELDAIRAESGAPATDRTFDRHGEPFTGDRDEATTDYFYDDGSGAEL